MQSLILPHALIGVSLSGFQLPARVLVEGRNVPTAIRPLEDCRSPSLVLPWSR